MNHIAADNIEPIAVEAEEVTKPNLQLKNERKKRNTMKGYVLADPSAPEPDTLIKLDAPPKIKASRTRSGNAV